MQRKRVVIVGAGISGLAAGWYLKKSHLPVDLIYVEKSARPGGWLQTDHTTGFHFEQGPRALKVSRSRDTVRLAAELGLHEEVIISDAKPHHRYLWHEEALHRFPRSPLAFLLSPLTKGFLKALLVEWRQPCKLGDETVWEFVLRRFNYDVARRFFDPLVVGIFGGDIRKISVKAAFPVLKQWEEQFGSVTRGFFYSRKDKRQEPKYSLDMPQLPMTGLFSFRSGIEILAQTLVLQLGAEFYYQEEVQGIEQRKEGIRIHTDKQQLKADAVILACPAHEAGQLLQEHFPELGKELQGIHSQGVAVVNAGYDVPVLPVEGFGYLTSTYSNEDVLGVVFDSSVFSQHNRHPQQTRLTIKLDEDGRSEEAYIQAALRGVRRHLGISRLPTAICFKRAVRAIPQYRVGHLERMAKLDEQLPSYFPHCHLVGNYLSGVSVNDCIARARHVICSQF